MSDTIRQLDTPKDGGRVETGPIQFGNDWPGFFLRGDSAFAVFLQLRNFTLDPTNLMSKLSMESFAKALLTCNTNKELVKQMETTYGLVAETADAADSKPADASRGGSTPSGPTTPLQGWQSRLPEAEKVVAVGQKRILFVDGIGEMEGVVTKFDDNKCFLIADGYEFEMDWEMPGMNAVGILMDGEEYKKMTAELEQEALSATLQN